MTLPVKPEEREWRDEIEADLRETLKAVLYFFGPEGANKVTSHVLMARKSRRTNAEIDDLERLLGGDELGEK